MKNKKLLVFGSNGALGKGVTKVFSGNDFDQIYLFDFKFSSDESAPNIKNIVIDDLSIEENVKSAFKNISPDKETLYFLFSTIGGYHGGEVLWDTKVTDFDKMMNINVKTNFLIAKYFSDLIKKSAGGSICLTSAYVADNPESGKSVYGASKAALSHLVKSISDEGVKINLTANAIAPYMIDTPANREWMDKKDYGKMIKPSEIGSLVLSIFNNFNFISGNIFDLKHRFDF
ncbi:MAG: SDR family oxidoreductase [Ignavibacterium sp.]|nr:SDR family oxidoreductase [Ignavibacterium sp.]